jgi:hypothetical protein
VTGSPPSPPTPNGTRLLVQTRSGSGAGASYWLVDRPLFRPQPLGQLAPLGVDETCRKTAPAMAPDGRRVAFACAAHVQIWRLGETAAETALERLLLLPGGGAMAALAFSSDGARLVAGHAGIAVWRTADWALEPFCPQPMPAPLARRWLVAVARRQPDGDQRRLLAARPRCPGAANRRTLSYETPLSLSRRERLR